MEKRTAKVGSKALQFWQQPAQPVNDAAAQSKTNTHHLHPELHHWALFESIAVFAILLIIWLLGVTQLRTIQLSNKKISSNIPTQQLETTLKQSADAYRLKLTAQGGATREFSLKDTGITINAAASAQTTKDINNSPSKKLLWWRPTPLHIVTTTNAQAFADFMKQHARTEITPVKNAALTINSDGTISTEGEAIGKEYALDGGEARIVQAIKSLDKTALQLKEKEVKPSITLDSLASSKAQLEKILSQKIVIQLDNKNISPDAHDIGAWIVVTPNETQKKYDFTIDTGKVGDYINKIAAANVRRPRNQVEVTHPDGTKSVLVQGVDGLDVANKDVAVKEISRNVLLQKDFTVALDIQKTPFKTTATTGGNKLLEVDITTKRMYAYENNVLVRTFLVSAGAAATPTVTGTFSIFSKVRIQDMRGTNADGSKYLQPDVEYVNYFYRDYAIHGNYWRPTSYFGNVNSSHGCVGIINSDAEWIYGWAPIGTQVVVHT